jgi:hypothetical protein
MKESPDLGSGQALRGRVEGLADAPGGGIGGGGVEEETSTGLAVIPAAVTLPAALHRQSGFRRSHRSPALPFAIGSIDGNDVADYVV